ncbi:uncharacterized protein LOC129224684 [Uloborus diversus]|uniref:uncharacterized protein LOC129224684 n=1 Tax=Uloborus diversus TaxID=327109 RepID=UPI0024099670|nr:uncharacterized protein LOC129224684 [Uloborus diversus]
MEPEPFKESPTPSSSEEDRKYVSKAVAFVMGHARSGFVSLCAGLATLFKEKAKLKDEVEELRQELELAKSELCMQKECHPETFKYLKGCACANCRKKKQQQFESISPPLNNGDKIVISGEICGTVCYVGHIDSLQKSEIYVGLCVDEAIGDSDGSVGEKTYFRVPSRHGFVVPLSHVLCVIK